MKNNFVFIFIISLIWTGANAQIGGLHVYKFLDLSSSARETALGENLITVLDDDVALAFANPSLSNFAMHHSLSFSNNFHFSGIENGHASYGYHLKKWDINLHTGIKYAQYGTFDRTDILGHKQGEFKANEMVFTIGGAKKVNERIRLGLNVKYIYSKLEAYTSTGLASDIAVHYYSPESQFTATGVIRNWGTQISSYDDSKEKLPFDVQIGFSKKLAHLPFRFSVIGHHLQRWNILYDDPNEENSSIFFEENTEDSKFSIFSDNLFRHIIFNGEFLLGKKGNFRLRAGYNHLRRQELRVSNFRGLGGFSAGVGIKVNRFRFDYGFGTWHLVGSNHHITFSTNITAFKKKI